MKSLVKGTLFAATAALVFAACNKDQGCINKLDGEWTAGEGKFWINGVEQVDTSGNTSTAVTTYTFSKFKMKDADEGTLVIKTTDQGQTSTTNATFKVTDDCKKFWWSTDATTATDDMTGDIIKLTGKEFTFEFSIQVPNMSGGNDTWKFQVGMTK